MTQRLRKRGQGEVRLRGLVSCVVPSWERIGTNGEGFRALRGDKEEVRKGRLQEDGGTSGNQSTFYSQLSSHSSDAGQLANREGPTKRGDRGAREIRRRRDLTPTPFVETSSEGRRGIR